MSRVIYRDHGQSLGYWRDKFGFDGCVCGDEPHRLRPELSKLDGSPRLYWNYITGTWVTRRQVAMAYGLPEDADPHCFRAFQLRETDKCVGGQEMVEK
ncbi:MAG: hypothetical protein M1830_008280 [Pleopsidium flavum]|nr:MAG: hypothetical protein M1830_008280 [Pleopsidium flavum]